MTPPTHPPKKCLVHGCSDTSIVYQGFESQNDPDFPCPKLESQSTFQWWNNLFLVSFWGCLGNERRNSRCSLLVTTQYRMGYPSTRERVFPCAHPIGMYSCGHLCGMPLGNNIPNNYYVHGIHCPTVLDSHFSVGAPEIPDSSSPFQKILDEHKSCCSSDSL